MIIRTVNTDKNVLVIAEIGNNHEGDITTAARLVQEAAQCGVGAVKFQTYRTEYLVSRSDNERFQRLKKFELSISQFRELSELAHSLGLLFLSTPLDLQSARGLKDLVDAYKIASGDVNFYPLIEEVLQTGKPIIISTGVSDYRQVSTTVSFIEQGWEKRSIPGELGILHCTSCYPTPPEQVNLQSIPFLKQHFSHTIGYSDHTIGIDAPLAAVALGARIIEKHFTISHSFSSFRDHQISAEPVEMRDLVQKIPQIGSMIGREEKTVQPCEAGMDSTIRRSIVSDKDLAAGHVIEPQDLTWIRPATGGLLPGEEHQLINKQLKRQITRGEQIRINDLE
jgi:N,N'-diacetyllegionaminate synthase